MTKVWCFINACLPLEEDGGFYTVVVEEGVLTRIEVQAEGMKASPEAVRIDEWNPHRTEAVFSHEKMECIDVQGKLLLPGLVDAHMHLDKSFSLPKVGNESGTLEEAVRNYAEAAPAFSKEEIRARILRAALQAIFFGTTAIRTHLDLPVRAGREVALRSVEAALEVKERLAPYLTLQLFPMCPYHRFSGPEVEVVEEALRMGVDGLGGAPHLSPTPEKDIDAIFRLAERYGCPVDLHTDESDDPKVRTIIPIAMRTKEYGFGGRVVVGHLCSLAAMPEAEAEEIILLMGEAGLGAVTLPGANLYLQGRRDRYPVRRGVTRVKELLAAGIPLATASDNIHDPFHPFGRGDLVQIGLLTAYAAHMGSPSDLRTLLRMVTEIPARLLGLKEYGMKVGNRADFVIMDSTAVEELFTMLPERRWVFRDGGFIRIAPAKEGWNDPEIAKCWEEALRVARFRPGQPLPFG